MKKLIFACFMLFAGMLQAADNTLGAGDMLRITVYGNPDLTTETRVTETGTVSFPLVGEVNVKGISVPEAERDIAKLLKDGGFIKQPQVNIVVLQFTSQQISVLGDVLKPGRYPIDHPSTLTDLLAIAGGVTASGSDLITVISRNKGKSSRREFDLRDMFRKNGSPDVGVVPGDIIYVPRAPMFYIYGEVQRPGAFRLERDMTAAQALATGGGLTPRGTERGLHIKRRNEIGELETISAEASTLLMADDVLVHDGSMFYIYGEVQRPGAFRLERNMTVAQALATGGGLTPRGTERGLRIKRRNAKGELETVSAEASTLLLVDDVLQIQESSF